MDCEDDDDDHYDPSIDEQSEENDDLTCDAYDDMGSQGQKVVADEEVNEDVPEPQEHKNEQPHKISKKNKTNMTKSQEWRMAMMMI